MQDKTHTRKANDLIQINAFVSYKGYCELGSKSGSASPLKILVSQFF